VLGGSFIPRSRSWFFSVLLAFPPSAGITDDETRRLGNAAAEASVVDGWLRHAWRLFVTGVSAQFLSALTVLPRWRRFNAILFAVPFALIRSWPWPDRVWAKPVRLRSGLAGYRGLCVGRFGRACGPASTSYEARSCGGDWCRQL